MIRGPGDASGVGAEWVDRPWPLVRALLAVVGVVLLVWVVYLLGPLPLVPVALALMAIVVGWLFMAIRGWDGQRYSLLWMLAIAAERRMPMATSVEAFADQYRGGFRRRVRQLAALLEGGAGLAFALRRVPGLASGETTMMVELGEENDRLGEALRRAADQHLDRSGATRQMTTLAAYLGFLLLFGTGIVFFILYFIVPKFEAIFHDFGIPLPGLTRFVIQAGHFLPSLLLAPLWILALPFQFLAFLLLTQADRYPAWFFAIVFLLYIFAAAAFVLGLLALFRASAVRFPTWSWRTRRAALILRALAMTAGANRPIEAGLRTLAIRYPSWRGRRRLAEAEDDVKRGVDWRDALRRRGLIQPAQAEALTTAQAVGNLPWAMNDLADAALRRANLRRALLAQTLWPVVVGALGAIVLLLAVAFFLPLVELIRRLS